MLTKYLVFLVFFLYLNSSTEALSCWFCVREPKEFPIPLEENCLKRQCPDDFKCSVEIFKDKSIRGCSPRPDCSHAKAKSHCRLCDDKDFCNLEVEKYYVRRVDWN